MARDLEWSLFSGFTKKAMDKLLDYDWPGNIRELKNVVERSLYRHGSEQLPVHEIIFDPFESPFRPAQRIKAPSTNEKAPEIVAPAVTEVQTSVEQVAQPENHFSFPCDLKTLSNEYEIDLLKKALEHSQFNQKKTAQMLSLTYHQLRGYLKKYNLLDQKQEA
jgi:psp operon transcriptional activator